MDGPLAAYAAAFTLGAAHALEVDHMVAVTAFVGGETRLGSAATFGLKWGLGHSLAVLVVGGLLAWSGLTIPPSFERYAEIAVGLALIAVGFWAWRNARRLHVSRDARGHHHHAHLSTMVGALHGLAGTAPVVALIPVTLMPSMSAAITYLVLFGLGTTAGMGAYAGLAAVAVSRAASFERLARAVAFGTAAASAAVGTWWLIRSGMGTG